MLLNLDGRYRRSGNLVSREIHEEMLLIPIKDNVGDMGRIYSLNGVGAFIWELLDGTRRVLDIKQMVVEEFDVSPQEAEKDLLAFLRDLQELGATVVESPG